MVDTEVVFVLEGEVETHKEGMVEESEDFFLTTDILHFLLTNDVPLVQDLHYNGGGKERRKIRERRRGENKEKEGRKKWKKGGE